MNIKYNYFVDRGFVKSISAQFFFKNVEFKDLIDFNNQIKIKFENALNELSIVIPSEFYTKVFLNLSNTEICFIVDFYIRQYKLTFEQIEKLGFTRFEG